MRPFATAVALLAPVWAGLSPELYPPEATINSGPIIGLQTRLPGGLSPVNQFLGIPYAEPPVRFEQSTPPKKWKEPLEVKEFGASCPENYGLGSLGPDPDLLRNVFGFNVTESEDCLTINVFAPVSKDAKARPVLVFIPGGGFQLGNSVGDFSPFAAYEDIIAVSFNYRTNVFGFPSSSAIPLSERNLGLLDQKLALSWVQNNIAHFGGDPSKVTLWGQSAGAHSVDTHLRTFVNSTSPPFRAAVMSSGQMSFGWTGLPSPGQEQWIALASLVGCPSEEDAEQARLECLKDAPMDDLINGMLQGELTFSPGLDDGTTLPIGGGKAWRDGNVMHVPILTGAMADEGTLLVGPNATMEEFLGAFFPVPPFTEDMVQAIVGAYKADPKLKSDFDVIAALYGEFLFRCPQTMLAAASATHQPTYLYYGNFTATTFLPPEYSWLGKFHAAEMVLMYTSPTDERHTPETRALADRLRRIFASFARDPSAGPGWDALGSDDDVEDVAVLGDIGDEETSGLAMRSRAVVDARCQAFAEVYAAMEQLLG